MMKHLLIINGQANEARRKKLLLDIPQAFMGLDYQVEITRHPHHATEIVQQYKQQYSPLRVYACGGDGTVHEVVNGIYPNQDIELAIIPIGTGNDFVKSFDRPIEDFRQLSLYQAPQFVYTDLIRTANEVSINTVSLGLDVRIASNVERFKRLPHLHSTVPYYLSLLYCLASSLYTPFTLALDDQPAIHDQYTFVVACNGQYYGGGYRPCPGAAIHDGLIDYCLINKVPRYLILKLANQYKQGTHIHYQQYVQTGQVKKITILKPDTVTINLDGEVRTLTHPDIDILPRQIRLCLPGRPKQ